MCQIFLLSFSHCEDVTLSFRFSWNLTNSSLHICYVYNILSFLLCNNLTVVSSFISFLWRNSPALYNWRYVLHNSSSFFSYFRQCQTTLKVFTCIYKKMGAKFAWSFYNCCIFILIDLNTIIDHYILRVIFDPVVHRDVISRSWFIVLISLNFGCLNTKSSSVTKDFLLWTDQSQIYIYLLSLL